MKHRNKSLPKHHVFTNEPYSVRHDHFHRTKPNKKYNLGTHPCGNCRVSRHTTCRLRMDGDLCSCDCPWSDDLRQDVEAFREGCKALGKPMPSNLEIAKEFGRRKPKKMHDFLNKNN